MDRQLKLQNCTHDWKVKVYLFFSKACCTLLGSFNIPVFHRSFPLPPSWSDNTNHRLVTLTRFNSQIKLAVRNVESVAQIEAELRFRELRGGPNRCQEWAANWWQLFPNDLRGARHMADSLKNLTRWTFCWFVNPSANPCLITKMKPFGAIMF